MDAQSRTKAEPHYSCNADFAIRKLCLLGVAPQIKFRCYDAELNVPSLDVEEAVALMIRAISQEQEEVWVAPTSQLMWVYFQYYCPQLRRFSHNVFARAECENLTRVKHDLVRDLKKRSGA